MSSPADRPVLPRWLHAWAVLTALATLPLVTLGAEVTTRKVGMVDKEGYRHPWHLFTVSYAEKGLGYFIEHGHRLAGFVVGTLCIVLAVGMAVGARRLPYRLLGLLALAAVSAQGVLGIYRVDSAQAVGHSTMAAIHGGFAQLVFATLVAVAVLTSRAWFNAPVTATPEEARGARRLAWALAGLLFVQIAFGSAVRHLGDRVAQRVHIALAFAVVALAVVLIRRVWAAGDRAGRLWAVALAVLLFIQPALGVEAWLRRFGMPLPADMFPQGAIYSTPAPDAALQVVRTAHHLVGTLLFSTAVVLALLLCRPAARVALQAAPNPKAAPLEGAA